ncbi:hypothetical protein Tco_1382599 [Tanacetum coccineum]
MITRNAGRCTTAIRGRGKSEQDGREDKRYGDQVRNGRGGQGSVRGSQGDGRAGQRSCQGSQGDGRGGQEIDQGSQAQVGNHVNNQKNNENQDNNNQGNVRTMNNGRGGCSYKEFMACSPKYYDGKGSAKVYTRWIEKMESVQDMSGCGENQKIEYIACSCISKALTWWKS